MEVRGSQVLPAQREDILLHTDDGLALIAELSLPLGPPAGTLVMLHPLPTAGGSMESHIVRKAAARLPALADIAVLRFNTRGTESVQGRSGGEFGEGVSEQHDLAAAMRLVQQRQLPNIWLVGWSFGTELALKYGTDYPQIRGIILLSPPLHRANEDDLRRWQGRSQRLLALVPEFDDFLPPPAARERFAVLPQLELIEVTGGKHLWVGENQTRRVLSEITQAVNPAAYPLNWQHP